MCRQAFRASPPSCWEALGAAIRQERFPYVECYKSYFVYRRAVADAGMQPSLKTLRMPEFRDYPAMLESIYPREGGRPSEDRRPSGQAASSSDARGQPAHDVYPREQAASRPESSEPTPRAETAASVTQAEEKGPPDEPDEKEPRFAP